MIRFIVHTKTSRTDRHGNRYHLTTVTSTKTGARLTFVAYGDRNGCDILRYAGLEWAELYVADSELPYRRWKSIREQVSLTESHVNAKTLLALED